MIKLNLADGRVSTMTKRVCDELIIINSIQITREIHSNDIHVDFHKANLTLNFSFVGSEVKLLTEIDSRYHINNSYVHNGLYSFMLVQ